MKFKEAIIGMILGLLFWILFLMAISCSPTKRMNKLMRRFPGLVKIDTVLAHDTTITEHVRIDTMLTIRELSSNDTIIITQGIARQKIYIKDSIIYTTVECLPDTVIKIIERTYQMRPDSQAESVIRGKKTLAGTLSYYLIMIILVIAGIMVMIYIGRKFF